MKRNGLISIVFSETPPGTNYRKGHWSWVSEAKALEYIEEGYGREWKPEEVKDSGEEYPKHVGGGWHELSDGEKVRGLGE